ncbi:alpha/beta hydrolase family protein [Agarilytica rhodophyticola]|uniref:alpha/beta hydrolase family protein n=1 Tax=Agarilytica rhodophyticola TaxID=1737490 RepID=UPI000B348F8E|nr:alpha/beta fold hydrolase [Agarilytica rhodophyticola]
MTLINTIKQEPITLYARDGVSLSATLFTPINEYHTALLINSGTGIPQGFYIKFAKYAASLGFVVLTFDYRGVGGSAPTKLKGFDARYRDWGQLDVWGAIEYISKRFLNLPLTVLGHSTGGQQLGLAQNHNKVCAATFVSVSTGYWGGLSVSQRLLSLFLWKLYIPITTKLVGYAPAKILGMGENLPIGVAKEWGSWCMEVEYLAAYFDQKGKKTSVDGKAFGNEYFSDITFPIRAYCFTDDHIATESNVENLQKLFVNNNISNIWIKPAQLDLEKIGHFGFFRSTFNKKVWYETLQWMRSEGEQSR